MNRLTIITAILIALTVTVCGGLITAKTAPLISGQPEWLTDWQDIKETKVYGRDMADLKNQQDQLCGRINDWLAERTIECEQLKANIRACRVQTKRGRRKK